MSSSHKKTNAVKARKAPRQKRAEDTVAIIVEAAARILELKGFEGFNTNAVADKAGVSIGSLYQYFPSKHALLSCLIERETSDLLKIEEELSGIASCKAAIQCYIGEAVRHQMRRPQLARLIDVAEKREMFGSQVVGTANRLQLALERILTLPGAPALADKAIASADLLALTRSLVDAAGERGEGETIQLLNRLEGAVWGYLGS